MANRTKQKERQRKKREQKRAEARRRASVSPYRQLGDGEMVACYVNRDWREKGMASLMVLVRLPGGGLAMAAFLVDIWCMGLKDAWGRLRISREDFDDHLVNAREHNLELERVDGSFARRLVAGGIHFARRNGFRLPKRYDRWGNILGDLGDGNTADLSDFGVNGRLRVMASEEDLRRRLVGCTVEQFLAREDVDFVLGSHGFSLLDDSEEEDELERVLEEMKKKGLNAVRRWCFAEGIEPERELKAARDVMLDSIRDADRDLFDTVLDGDDDAPLSDEQGEALDELVSSRFAPYPEARRPAIGNALDQLRRFMQAYESPAEFFASLGFDPEDYDDLLATSDDEGEDLEGDLPAIPAEWPWRPRRGNSTRPCRKSWTAARSAARRSFRR